ncbi:uncharacterized protein LOC141905649 [Tubulanus polymorphus]|uniref:uncharacterized protein LOC141905649 n=1 Tax=Tubulanus polymorphus TaxID=672921 RepID=UPI003DA47C84
MDWEYLPSLLLEEIFSLLPMKDRYSCSLVCKSWQESVFSRSVWRTMIITDRSFTRRKFTMYKGYSRELEHKRIQRCLGRVGHLFSSIVFTPISDFYNLYEILHVLVAFQEFFDEYPMPLLDAFHFTFSCESRGQSGTFVYGTGGQIFAEFRKFLANLRGIKYLKLNQLLLGNADAQVLLADLTRNCADTVVTLEMLNSSQDNCPQFHVPMFHVLQTLTISPHNLNDEIIIMLSQNGLPELVITQDQYTPKTLIPVSPEAWYEARKICSRMRVKLQVIGQSREDILHQIGAPVNAVVYETPYTLISASSVITTADLYGDTLQFYGHKCLPRTHNGRSFNERADSSLLLLVRSCSKLQTLVVRDRVSTATVLLIARECRQLQTFYVRLNAVIKRMDWPREPNWSPEFYNWLKTNSRSYERMQEEVSKIFGENWRPLTDKEFVKLCGPSN